MIYIAPPYFAELLLKFVLSRNEMLLSEYNPPPTPSITSFSFNTVLFIIISESKPIILPP